MNYVKVSALIAGLSIATVSVPPVKALISTDFLNQKNQISSNTLQKEAQAKPHLLSSVSNTLSSSNLKAEAVAQDNKLQFIQNTQSEAQPEVIKEQTGKLKIVNDTPFIAIVQLYQPNADEPYRYAYIPPCYQRSFLNTYSNLWQVSFNAQDKKPVGDVSDKIENTFVVRTSNLNQDTNRTCKYKLTAERIISLSWEDILKVANQEFKDIENLPIADSRKIPFLARILEKVDLRYLNSLPIEIQQLGNSKVKESQEILSSLPFSDTGREKYNVYLQANGSNPVGYEKYKESFDLASTREYQGKKLFARLPKKLSNDAEPIVKALFEGAEHLKF